MKRNKIRKAKMSVRYISDDSIARLAKETAELKEEFNGLIIKGYARKIAEKRNKKLHETRLEGLDFKYMLSLQTKQELDSRIETELFRSIGTNRAKSKIARNSFVELSKSIEQLHVLTKKAEKDNVEQNVYNVIVANNKNSKDEAIKNVLIKMYSMIHMSKSLTKFYHATVALGIDRDMEWKRFMNKLSSTTIAKRELFKDVSVVVTQINRIVKMFEIITEAESSIKTIQEYKAFELKNKVRDRLRDEHVLLRLLIMKHY